LFIKNPWWLGVLVAKKIEGINHEIDNPHPILYSGLCDNGGGPSFFQI
jgi:hypothetical protein